MKTLAEIYERYRGADCHSGSDKGSVHSYIPVYEELLAPYRDAARVLEVGIMTGHSLRMWEEYFALAHAGGGVHGIDLCDRPHDGLADLRPMIAEGTHKIHLLDATDGNQLFEHLGPALGGLTFDVIIEDAGHSPEQQLVLLHNLLPYLSPTGLYVIEDVEDVERDRASFEGLGGRVIDLRPVKGRFDDVLVVFGGPT